jgi:hypothetical protein
VERNKKIVRCCRRADRMETTNTCNIVKKKCDKAVLVDKWKTDWVDAAWRFMANDRLIMQGDCNVSCLDTLGYVTAGNSQLK